MHLGEDFDGDDVQSTCFGTRFISRKSDLAA
jgi:hypothetical protein